MIFKNKFRRENMNPEQERRNKKVLEEIERILRDENFLRRLIIKLAPELITSYKEKNDYTYTKVAMDILRKDGEYGESSIRKIVKGQRQIPEKKEKDETLQAIVKLKGSKELLIDKTIEFILDHIRYTKDSDVYLPPITLEDLKLISLESSNKAIEKSIQEWIQNLKPISPADLDKAIEESIQKEHNELLKRAENLKINSPSDLQALQLLKCSWDFYEKYPGVDLLFFGFFSKQYDLFSQLLDKQIEPTEFSAELEKLLDIVYAKIEFENDK